MKKTKRLLVGITGGIGAGKSAVADILRAQGFPVFSADEIAREVVSNGAPALEEIRSLFGDSALLPDGTLDRAHVRARIVHDTGLRLQLEAITHPRIQARAQELAEAAFSQGAKIVFYEAPLLFEARSDRKMDKVICVFAEDEVRIARVRQRDGCDRAHAQKLIASQMAQEEKKRLSDYLIENEGDREELARETETVVEELRSLLA